MAQQDVVDTSKLVLVVASGTLITIATIFAVQALHYWGEHKEFERKNQKPPHELVQTREAGQQLLLGNRVANADAANKRYAITIEEAKQRVIGKLSQ